MIEKAKAKINIGLRVVGKREDGYHLLESCMYPIDLHDIIEIIARSDGGSSDRLECFGIICPDSKEDNLVMRAVRLFRESFYPQMPYLDIALYKNIPFGAGMGGGSSDATATMRLLKRLFNVEIKDEDLALALLKLGADCPFFAKDSMQIARGIGEKLSPFEIKEIKGKHLLIIKPNIHISTKEAFKGINIESNKEKELEEILNLEMKYWQKELKNSFENTIFPSYPDLGYIKDWMLKEGAIYASMTGSGSSIFAFSKEDLSSKAKEEFPDCFIFSQIC